MRRITAIVALALLPAAFAVGAAESTTPDGADLPQPPRAAAAVLSSATALFPADPVSLYGSLIVRRQSGVLVREIPFAMSLDWGATPAAAEYTLMDSFGRTLLAARVTRAPDGATALECRGADGAPAPAPPLTAQIMGTDITWLDITLAYLWWEDATLLEPETFKGSLCDVVEVRPPSPIEGCSAVRLWIDRKHSFLRQAEQLGPNGERARWMWVASVGKIGGRWMIRNLEVKRPGTGFQTKLHVDDLDTP